MDKRDIDCFPVHFWKQNGREGELAQTAIESYPTKRIFV